MESQPSVQLHRTFFAIAILLSGTICVAGDEQAARSCRDKSIPARQTGTQWAGGKSSSELPPKPHGIRLSWKASIPASTAAADAIAGYNIFRHESAKDCEQTGNACEKINQALISGTSCTDYFVQGGHTYIYQVQAVSAGKIASRFSREAKAVMPQLSDLPR